MKTNIVNKKVDQLKADVELILVDKSLKQKWVKDAQLFKPQGFKGSLDQVLYLPEKGRIYAGVDSFADSNNVRVAAALAVMALKGKDVKSLKCGYYGDASTKALVEGVILGTYVFEKFKKKKTKIISSLNIACESLVGQIDIKAAEDLIAEARIEAEAQNFVRDIVNRPPADVTPAEFTRIARALARDKRVGIKVYGEDYLKKKGMGAFLAVGLASPHQSQLIHLSYKHPRARKRVALVGKGLTYDTGGLSLKPNDGMRTMKLDKAGASVVLGVMKAVSELKLPIDIEAVLGVTENVVGRHAYKPDDILTAMNGKTIEIVNTDAEGRLVLADCLCYAQKQEFDYIVDLATLTGASMIGIGRFTSGVMGWNKDLVNDFVRAGEESGEMLAYLPFNRELRKLLDSFSADVCHLSSEPYGGAITAALFLSEFIDDKNRDKWIHLDIAGKVYTAKPWGPYSAGATGACTRLMIHWLKGLALSV